MERPDDPGIEHRVEQNRRGFAEHNAMATFSDMESARAAISALEAAGVEGSHISLIGPRAEEAAEETDMRAVDEGVTADVGRKVAVGAAAGTALGGAAGFVAGLIAFAIPGVGPVIGTGVWAATIGGAVAGGGVGGVVGGVAGVDQSGAWELTYQNVREGRVVVGVHADDGEEIESAAEVLRGRDPLSLRRFDGDGTVREG